MDTTKLTDEEIVAKVRSGEATLSEAPVEKPSEFIHDEGHFLLAIYDDEGYTNVVYTTKDEFAAHGCCMDGGEWDDEGELTPMGERIGELMHALKASCSMEAHYETAMSKDEVLAIVNSDKFPDFVTHEGFQSFIEGIHVHG